ncbi:MAG: hypothetical protein IJO56_00240 [Oscillospiraceae bacterium]|nr:hypothetical protein [Oscillospiraceae bacterium]
MNNISNTDAQRQRKKDAWHSALFSTLWMLLAAGVMLFLRWRFPGEGLLGALLGIFAVLDLGMIVPVWILLKTRLKEIEGGEEDAAAQY